LAGNLLWNPDRREESRWIDIVLARLIYYSNEPAGARGVIGN